MFLFYQNCSQKFRNIHRKTTVLESLFNKVAGLHACMFIEKDSNIGFSCVNREIFKNIYFEKYLRTAASDNSFTLVIYLF